VVVTEITTIVDYHERQHSMTAVYPHNSHLQTSLHIMPTPQTITAIIATHNEAVSETD
jgi:hypothetical protein